jgi:hypothetical protein
VGRKKYNGPELDERTGGSRVSGSVARDGERTRPGEKAAERKESFLRADVTAEAVTYKARERATADRRRRGDHCVVEMIRLGARLGSQSQI